MKSIYDVIKRPLVTEKTTGLGNDHHQIVVEVNTAANKLEIANAASSLFNVKVECVKTLNVRGKVKRVNKYSGKRKNWKKAFITLSKDSDLDIFGVLPPVGEDAKTKKAVETNK